MRMRKYIVVAVLMSVGAQAVSATDITLRPYIGYGFGMARQYRGSDRVTESSGLDSRNETILYSAGAGLKAGLGVDVGLRDNFSVEPVIGYSKGLEKIVAKRDKRSGTPYIESTKESTSFIPFSITLKVRAKEGAFTPYAGFGPTFIFGAKGTTIYDYSTAGMITKTEREITYNMGFGFHGVAGADYNVSDSFVIFGQLRADQLSLTPSKSKVTKYTENGVDALSTLSVASKETTYKDDTGGYVFNANTPFVDQAKPLAASSVAINFGIAYKF